MHETVSPVVDVVDVARDATTTFTLGPREMLLWFGYRGGLADPLELDLLDGWSFRGHTTITVTDRSCDLPSWFSLHPTEVSGALGYVMMRRSESGQRPPATPIENPGVWRVKAGDRLVRCRRSLRSKQVKRRTPITVYAFHNNAAVIGCEGDADSAGGASAEGFGSPDHREPTEQEVRAGRAAVEAIVKLGVPPEISLNWTLSL